MLAKRIIPCLDIKNGRTVKGTNFVNLRDAGDPVELAIKYSNEGADELVFLDISATQEERETIFSLVKRVGEEIIIPYTVGGGIDTLQKAYKLLHNGAEKVSINSAAIYNPKLVTEIAAALGSQCVVVAIDARNVQDHWKVLTHGGSRATDLELFDWAREMEDRGAGEILFTSMDHDGTKEGFAIEALAKLNAMLQIPIVASGGAGQMHHFVDVFDKGKASAALAASIFHYNEIPIPILKQYLAKKGIPIRL